MYSKEINMKVQLHLLLFQKPKRQIIQACWKEGELLMKFKRFISTFNWIKQILILNLLCNLQKILK